MERRGDGRSLKRYLVRYDDAGEMRLAFSHDLSEGGLFLVTRRPPPPGSSLRLLIRTARGARREDALVVWARLNLLSPNDPDRASGVGLRFTGRDATVRIDA